MTPGALALPRIKVRRKRKKPLSPWGRFWLAVLIFNLTFLFLEVFKYLVNFRTKDLIFAGIHAACACQAWYFFKPEWDRRDED